MSHLLGMTAATAGIILCTLLPFLPGRYDSLAVPLSMMSQMVGILGLLLVPVGVLWMASEYRSRNASRRYIFAITALIASSVVWVMVSLGGALESLILGFGILALWGYVLSRVLPRLRPLRNATPGNVSAIPLYLIVVPIAVLPIQLAMAGPVTEFSRNRAIRNSAPLIGDIERYRAANGRYPLSLVSLWKDYSPSVIGIKEYRYEPAGDAYNLLFEQFSFRFGTREIVMYNPRDQQVMTSHAMDLLQLTPEQLVVERTRGHYAVHDCGFRKL